MAERCINTFDFVGCDARSNTRTANHNCAINLPALNCQRRFFGIIRVVNRRGIHRPQVNDFVLLALDDIHDLLLQWEPSMITSNGSAHNIVYPFSNNSLALVTTRVGVRPNSLYIVL